MRILRSLAVAFSTYSKIPMPHCLFDEANMRYSLCFFPLVGVVVGAAFALVRTLVAALALGPLLTGALSMLTPLIVTGGIHMDGFMDTMDALSSWQPREKRLEILSDPHIGAFGALSCAAYLIVQTGVMAEPMPGRAVPIIALSFVVSRALSGLTLLTFRGAKSTGLLHAFKVSAERGVVLVTLILWLALAALAMLLLDPLRGACALMAATLAVVYYRVMAYRRFGGVTGDLAGFFLQLCELVMALTVVLI